MRVKNEKGSITIFVLVALLFMSAFLMISYANNVNKSKVVKEQLDIMGDIYYKENDSQSYEDAYYKFIKENKNLITATVENKYNIEIKNASKGEKCNYRIWGNTIPDATNPAEMKYVGDKVNLLDISNPKYTANSTHSIKFEEKIENGVLYNAGVYASADGACMYIEKPEGVQYLTLSFEAGDEAPDQPTTGYRYRFYYFNEIDETTGIPTDLYRGTGNDYVKGYNSCISEDCSSYKYVGFTIIALSKHEVSFRNIQIEEGTDATTYTPYNKYRIPIKVSGKNLACYQSIKENGFVEQEDGEFLAVSSRTPYKRILFDNKDKVSGQFTISYYTKFILSNNYVGCYPMIYYTDGTKKALGDLQEIAKKPTEYVKVTYTTDVNKVVDKIIWGLYTGGAQTFFKDMQIEYGNTATAYEPYAQKYNIYLDSPLAQEDYINFASGKVKRADGTEENVNLPEILISEDYAKIEVLTEIVPSKIEVEYVGYEI